MSTPQVRLRSTVVYVVLFVLLASFFAGYFLHEGKTSPAHWDLTVYHIPAIQAFQSQPLSIALKDYPSATTPLFHLLSAFGPVRYDHSAYYLASTVLSAIVVAIFAVMLAQRFGYGRAQRTAAILFASFLLISPYYRTQAFWPSTDNMATAFTVLTLLCLSRFEEDTQKPLSYFLGAAFACALTFYTRQSYLWLVAYTGFIVLLRGSIARAWVLIFVPLMLPGAYLFHLWHGLTPPQFQLHHQGFTLEGVAFVFFSVFLLAIPFLAASPRLLLEYFRSDRMWLLDIAFALIFAFIRQRTATFATPGSGILISGIFVNILLRLGGLAAPVFACIVVAGAVITSGVFRRVNLQSRALIVLLLGSTLLTRVSFQRYYDPLLLIVFLGAIDRQFVRRHFTVKAAAWTALLETAVWTARMIR